MPIIFIKVTDNKIIYGKILVNGFTGLQYSRRI